MLFSLKYLMSFLYVSGVVQFSLMTLFARLFVQYCSSSAMSCIRFIISLYFMTVDEDGWRFMNLWWSWISICVFLVCHF